MKKIAAFVLFLFSASFAGAQNIDSILAQPQVVELTMSTPQPRLNETFEISIDMTHLRANIFKSLIGKVQFSNDGSNTSNGKLTIHVEAIKKGKNEIGPLEFYLDKTKYTTNKVIYEVVDALPNVDKGLWFRVVMTSDSTFSIIIEQRIPANTKITETDKTVSITTQPEYTDIVKFKGSYSIKGANGGNSHSTTSFDSVTINGEEKKFMSGFSVYNFAIYDRKGKIKISKDQFENLPSDYKFENLLIQ